MCLFTGSWSITRKAERCCDNYGSVCMRELKTPNGGAGRADSDLVKVMLPLSRRRKNVFCLLANPFEMPLGI